MRWCDHDYYSLSKSNEIPSSINWSIDINIGGEKNIHSINQSILYNVNIVV